MDFSEFSLDKTSYAIRLREKIVWLKSIHGEVVIRMKRSDL